VFRGQKVLLRALKRSDLERQWEFENDPELWYWDGGIPKPSSLEILMADFEKIANNKDSVEFSIEAEDKYIGHCSLHSFDEVGRNCQLSVEIGDKNYQGRGYGREAVRLLLDYAFVHRNLNRVYLYTHSENERAIRAYQACGFVEEGRMRQQAWIRGHFVDTLIMGILKSDYENKKN
jgi:RimJ/RimL family protein N-acetyltransferase